MGKSVFVAVAVQQQTMWHEVLGTSRYPTTQLSSAPDYPTWCSTRSCTPPRKLRNGEVENWKASPSQNGSASEIACKVEHPPKLYVFGEVPFGPRSKASAIPTERRCPPRILRESSQTSDQCAHRRVPKR